jgi:hypothetical protein
MICNRCHNQIPANQGYYLHTWAGKVITTCYNCKPAPERGACGHKNAWYEPCTRDYGHDGLCAR